MAYRKDNIGYVYTTKELEGFAARVIDAGVGVGKYSRRIFTCDDCTEIDFTSEQAINHKEAGHKVTEILLTIREV